MCAYLVRHLVSALKAEGYHTTYISNPCFPEHKDCEIFMLPVTFRVGCFLLRLQTTIAEISKFENRGSQAASDEKYYIIYLAHCNHLFSEGTGRKRRAFETAAHGWLSEGKVCIPSLTLCCHEREGGVVLQYNSGLAGSHLLLR